MPDAKRPDPKRRTPASRPGRGGGRPRGATPIRREPRVIEARPAPEAAPNDSDDDVHGGDVHGGDEPTGVLEPIRKAIAEAAEQQSEQRLGSAARRAAILAVVVCVLTLTIAGPVRTYFSQRTEMKQLSDAETQLRSQITDLEQQKIKLGDPVYIAAQARERLGFVMPGDIPYQVQLPPSAAPVEAPSVDTTKPPSGQPWYTSLWKTIADAPHGVSVIPQTPDVPPDPGAPLPPGAPGPPPPGG